MGAGQAVPPDHGLIIGRGKIRKREKGASGRFRGGCGHAALPDAGDIRWRGRRLVIGTGADGALPVSQGHQGHHRHVAPGLLTGLCQERKQPRPPAPAKVPSLV